MTAMLASVRSLDEAVTAFQHGADIIDLKEPDAGALGAVSPATARDIVKWVNGRIPVSATVGDLSGDESVIAEAVLKMAATGVDIVKVGMFFESERARILRALAPIAVSGVQLVAVLFADRESTLDPTDMAGTGFSGAMIDTADKGCRSLRECVDDNRLRRFVAACARLELRSGLAGSLKLADIPALLALRPAYLGFRGALCKRGERGQQLSADRLRQVRSAVSSAATGTLLLPAVAATSNQHTGGH